MGLSPTESGEGWGVCVCDSRRGACSAFHEETADVVHHVSYEFKVFAVWQKLHFLLPFPSCRHGWFKSPGLVKNHIECHG